MNVLCIVSDTIRQDFFGLNGGSVSTPNLDALGRESVRFERMQASSFPTVPARVDYMTGTYAFPSIGWGALPRDAVTFAQILNAKGVVTAAVVDTPFYLMNGYNLDRGFRHFYDIPGQDMSRGKYSDEHMARRAPLVPEPRLTEFDYPAPRTMTIAEQCLEQLRGTQPFLLWVDTWDPHEPWDPPHWYVEQYKSDYDGTVVWPPYQRYQDAGVSDEELATGLACYCGKLTMVDRWIGRLLDRLDTLGLRENTTVIFLSDHGYYFAEHGGIFGKMIRTPGDEHANWLRSPLYNEVANVPFWIRRPEQAPRSDQRLVSAIDVAPTILDLFGAPTPQHFHGRSVVPLLESEDAPEDDVALTSIPLAVPGEATAVVDDIMRVVSEWQPITITSGKWTMLFSRWADPIELYDNASDPAQHDNVAAAHPDVVQDLHAKLIAELQRAGASERQLAVRAEKAT